MCSTNGKFKVPPFTEKSASNWHSVEILGRQTTAILFQRWTSFYRLRSETSAQYKESKKKGPQKFATDNRRSWDSFRIIGALWNASNQGTCSSQSQIFTKQAKNSCVRPCMFLIYERRRRGKQSHCSAANSQANHGTEKSVGNDCSSSGTLLGDYPTAMWTVSPCSKCLPFNGIPWTAQVRMGWIWNVCCKKKRLFVCMLFVCAFSGIFMGKTSNSKTRAQKIFWKWENILLAIRDLRFSAKLAHSGSCFVFGFSSDSNAAKKTNKNKHVTLLDCRPVFRTKTRSCRYRSNARPWITKRKGGEGSPTEAPRPPINTVEIARISLHLQQGRCVRVEAVARDKGTSGIWLIGGKYFW